MADLSTQLFFEVHIDGLDLGAFTGCEGLSAEYEITEYQEGGENDYVHRIPGRLKYPTIKLTRPLNAESKNLASWFASYRDAVSRRTGAITAYDCAGAAVSTWNLVEVCPVRWSGPTFSTDQGGSATETLELAHNGFIQ
jgi:phage tail-like protein